MKQKKPCIGSKERTGKKAAEKSGVREAANYMENSSSKKSMLYKMYQHEKPTWRDEVDEYYDISAMRYCPYCNTDIVANWQIPHDPHDASDEPEREVPYKIAKYLVTGKSKPSDATYSVYLYKEDKELTVPGIEYLDYRNEIVTFHAMKVCPVCGKPLVDIDEYHASFTLSVEPLPNALICDPLNFRLGEKYNFTRKIQFPLNEQGAGSFNISSEEYESIVDDSPMTYNGVLITRATELWYKYEGRVRLECFDTTLESKLEFFRRQRQPKLDAAITEEVEHLCSRLDNMPVEDLEKKDKITGDKNLLTQYIKNIATLEVNIHSLVERISQLYRLRQEGRHFNFEGGIEAKERLNAAEREYKMWQNKTAGESINHDDYLVTVPAPLPLPEEPSAPVLETPGFFNKKKIALANAAKMAAYEVEMKSYKTQLARYNARLTEIEQVKRKNEEGEQRYLDDLNNETLHIAAMQNEAHEKLQALQNASATDGADMITPNMVSYQLVLDEIATAEKALQDAYDARNKLYSYDVVFGKYRNLTAISTLYEYLSCGRCSTLDGADGAYNLYESELRANIIITQLTQVIESLEQIKENQYVLYSAISETNRQLNSLNESMNHAIGELQDIKVTANSMHEQLKKVEHNTALTAYNTEVTAYYAKKNAELTNALGYMIALA